MLRLNREHAVFLAILACAVSLVACANDPYTDDLRPTAADRAASPNAPAGTFGALIRVGEATRQAGNPAGAIPFFRRAHSLDMFKAEPLVRLGVALNDLGQFNEAQEAFHDALNLEHNNTEALRGLGFALIGLNQPEMAIDQFKAAIGVEPDYRSYNGLGVASDHLGEHKAAQDYYEAGLKIFPNNLTLLNNLGLSQILSRDYDAAIATLIGAVQQTGASIRQRQNLALAYGMAGKDADAARVARIDLGPKDVQDNLAYYPILRGADDKVLLAAILGVHAPDRLVSQPAPAQPEPQTGPASDAGTGAEAPAPAAKPTSSVETRPAPIAHAEPNDTETRQAAAAKPAAGTSHIRSVVAISIPTDHPSAAAKAAVETANQSSKPAAAVTQSQTPAETSAPRSSEQQTGNGQTQANAVQPASAQQEGNSTINALTQDSRSAGEAPSPPSSAPASPPAQAAAIQSQQDPAPVQPAAKSGSRPQPAAVETGGAPVWYAPPAATAATGAAHQETFLDRVYDYLFQPHAPAASKVAAATPRPAGTASVPSLSQTATGPQSENVAAIQPAAGATHSNSGWLGDIGEFFQARQGAIPATEHQPIGGGAAASP